MTTCSLSLDVPSRAGFILSWCSPRCQLWPSDSQHPSAKRSGFDLGSRRVKAVCGSLHIYTDPAVASTTCYLLSSLIWFLVVILTIQPLVTCGRHTLTEGRLRSTSSHGNAGRFHSSIFSGSFTPCRKGHQLTTSGCMSCLALERIRDFRWARNMTASG